MRKSSLHNQQMLFRKINLHQTDLINWEKIVIHSEIQKSLKFCLFSGLSFAECMKRRSEFSSDFWQMSPKCQFTESF